MKRSKLFLSFVISALIFIPSQNAWAASQVSGKVTFEGTAPAPEKIAMNADPNCLAMHSEPVLSEAVVVNGNGTLKNVFVYVKEGLEGQTFESPKEPVVFDQATCMYKPHVFGVMVNQPIEILNSDNTLHNVHAVAKTNKEFNLGMPIKGMKLKKSFSQPEVMVKMKCDVHPWMNAWVGVLNHPYFGVSGEDGSFNLKDLPAGNYVIEAWHEKFGAQTQSVTIAEGETKELAFTFKG